MTKPALCFSEWAELQSAYANLLQTSSEEIEAAAEKMARRLIEADTPYAKFEALHAELVNCSGLGEIERATADKLRSRILAAYDRAFLDYRKLEKKYRAELLERRKASVAMSSSVDALATSRDNLRTELSLQQRILAERSAELEVMNRKIVAQRDELAGFLYSVSHDLKSPMNTAKGLLSLFLEDSLDVDIDLTFVKNALATVSRTGVMLDDLLNFSLALDAEPGDETVDLDVLIACIFQDLTGGGTSRSLTFSKDRLPKVTGSETQLRLLFQNLIANGAKFHPSDRTPHVEVKNKGPRGISHYAIAVVDSGIGIDPDYHEQIFGLFKRLHAHHEYPGTGIGLSLCQRIVLNHRGQIHLCSEPGKGSTFTVVLPL